MTVPILPTPARPVDDAIIETGWGTWAHDNLLYANQGRPHARVTRTASQTIPNNAATALAWQTARVDVGALWNVATPTRLTIADPGWYAFGASVSFATNASGIRQLTLRANGATALAVNAQVPPPGAIFPVEMSLHTEVFLAVGYVEVLAYQNSGGGLAAELRAQYSPEAWLTWLAA